MTQALIALSVILAVALLALALLWRRARARAAGAEAALAGARRETERARAEQDDTGRRTQARVRELEAALAELRPRTWIEEFERENVYRLLARHETEAGEGRRFYGLVRDEVGVLSPYLTAQPMEHLRVGDYFGTVRGQLVRLESGAFAGGQQSAPPPAAASLHEADTEVRAGTGPAAGLHEADTEVGAAPPDDRTRILAGGPAPPAAEAEAALPLLRVTAGPDQGRDYRLPFAEAAVGRGEGNVVQLSDDGTSRVHCILDYHQHGFRLRDNRSTNGTLLNGERVEEARVEFGDRIAVGETEMVFTCEGYELRATDPERAIAAFEQTLERAPDFLLALRNLAFLLEKSIARQRDAAPLWERIARLERGA